MGTSEAEQDVGPIFKARYRGWCDCGEPIEPGDFVRIVNGHAQHSECVE